MLSAVFSVDVHRKLGDLPMTKGHLAAPRALLLTMSLLSLTGPVQAEELIPCFTCSTSECPTNELPRCPQKRRPRATRAVQPPATEQRPAEASATAVTPIPERLDSIAVPAQPAPQPLNSASPSAPKALVVTSGDPANPKRSEAESKSTVAAPATKAASHWLRWAGAAVGTGGLLLTGFGVPFLVYGARDGKISCAEGTNPRACPTLYGGNLQVGVTLAAVGGAALISSVIMIVIDARRSRRVEPRLTLVLPGLQSVAR